MGLAEQDLHPLHSPKWVADFVLNSGRLPGKRGTGRTSIGLLKTLVDALSNPTTPQPYIDHYFVEKLAHIQGETQLLYQLERRLVDIVKALGLRGVSFYSEKGASSQEGWRPARLWVCFGRPHWATHNNWSSINGGR